jgi:5-(carboxyamino)imidazole ribonucleotide synthase
MKPTSTVSTSAAPPAPSGPLLPGATLGVLGSGQLGRMFAMAARRMGYRVAVFSDDHSGSSTPAGQVADHDVVSQYDNPTMVPIFARGVDAVTVEFENIPVAAMRMIEAAGVPVRPGPAVVEVAQHRGREKRLFGDLGLETVRWSDRPLADAVEEVGFPAVAKTATLGYDGRGQWRLERPADIAQVPEGLEVTIEQRVELAAECSVIVARGAEGGTATFPVIENHHRGGILDWSIAPARLPARTTAAASDVARRVAEGVGLVGVICVEFFVTTDGRLLANEIAPRPHNSGHLTIEAAEVSQFEQQVRTVCGLPLGSTNLHRPAAMVNLLGDLWSAGEPNWAAALAVPGVYLHLYGKAEARPTRKMGHLTVMAPTATEALELALESRRRLVDREERQPE